MASLKALGNVPVRRNSRRFRGSRMGRPLSVLERYKLDRACKCMPALSLYQEDFVPTIKSPSSGTFGEAPAGGGGCT